jgi:hypothetical protein
MASPANAYAPAARPRFVTALSVFFTLGAAISAICLVALLFPGGLLESLWGLNPRARAQFQVMGHWAVPLMGVVSAACATAAVGLWRGRRFGYLLGVALLAVSFLGDLANALLGEPRAWVGVPISAALLVLLTKRSVRDYFARRAAEGSPRTNLAR